MPDTFQMYKSADFNTYTLASSTGTETGTWTLVEAFASNFPTEFPIIAEAYSSDPSLYPASREIVIITGNSIPSRQLTVSTRGVSPTSAYNHLAGSYVRLLLTATAWNNIIDEIRTVRTLAESKLNQSTYNTLLSQGNIPNTSLMTTGEAYSATTTANGITGPTVLYRATSDGRLYRLSAAVSPQQLMDNVYLAAEASTGAGESKRVYHAPSIVSGWTGLSMNVGAYYPDTATPGGLSTSVGAGWKQIIEPLSTTVARLKDSGRNSQNHTTAGSAGTNAFNNGTATTLARSDHEHKVLMQWTPIIQAPTSGANSFYYVNKTGLTMDILSLYAVVNGTVGTTQTTAILQKASQASIDAGSPSWSTLTSPNLTIDANEWSSETAATPVGLSGATLANGEHMRIQISTAGTGLGDTQFFLVMKCKNTN